MQLYTSPTTPFGRKVMVQIIESGLQSKVAITEVSGNPLDPGSMPVAHNPLGKIPALVIGGGQAIYDSRVISRYLDAQSGAGLYPQGEALWPVLTLEATADGMTDAAVLMTYEMRMRPENLRFAPWVDGQWAKIARALDALEAGRPGPLDGALTMGQIALGCALSYLDFRHGARRWQDGRPRLAAWAETFSRRPAMLATVPRG